MGYPCRPIADRFWPKVDKNGPSMRQELGPCWVWTGCRTGGYGRLNRGGKRCKLEIAHRVSWEIHFGSVPVGACVLHRCDNPPCVNPAHLFLGTNPENTADKVTKGRQAAGESHGMATLTVSDVAEIRALRSAGVSGPIVAARFGISNAHVHRIATGQCWVGT